MIITDKFVMLNFPKTGSTFAREAIKLVYGKKDLNYKNFFYKTGILTPRIFELILPKINEGPYNGIMDQHGKYLQIPLKYRKKQILTIIRNPFSRIVSDYYFKWWQNFLPTDINTILKYYPNFPNLSFHEYYDFKFKFNRVNNLNGINPQLDLGDASLYFIQFYSKDPKSLLKKINTDYFENKEFIKDFSHIHFIHQENLVPELKSFLIKLGFDKTKIDTIDQLKKVNENKYPEENINFMNLYDNELINKMLKHERLLFELFPEYLPK